MQSSTFSQKPGKDLSGLGIEMVYVDHIFWRYHLPLYNVYKVLSSIYLTLRE